MLRSIEIENFAIIDNLRLDFDKSLNIFTGETGAGKTIIIEALSVALGDKAGAGAIRTGEKKAKISVLFDISGNKRLQKQLSDMTGAQDDEILLQREIVSAGKGNCYLNNKLIALSALKEIGNVLVDIHGQHEHQSLLNISCHIDLLDSFGGFLEKQKDITKGYNILRQKENRLEELSALEKDKESMKDLLQFQVDEIKNAGLSDNEDNKIEKEFGLLVNSEKLTQAVSGIYEELYEAEGAVIEKLKKISIQMHNVVSLDPDTKKFMRLFEDSNAVLSDLASELRAYRDLIENDPKKLEELTDKRDLIGKLKKKYGATIPEILKFGKNAENKLKEISTNEEEIKKLSDEIKEIREKLLADSRELSKKRKSAAEKLEKKIETELAELEMRKTRFHADIKNSQQVNKSISQQGKGEEQVSQQVNKLTSEQGEEKEQRSQQVDKSTSEQGECKIGAKGIDEVEFLISPNPGEDLRPLAKIASGGETSRIMLALKSILAQADEVPVMVFDEIDMGIGGKTASSVGVKLEKLAEDKQILCITHLPQIASIGKMHFRVEKAVEKGRTRVSVRELKKNERVEEIARMISGEKVTPTSLKHAEELLEGRP